MENNKVANLLWTGGWDSTFRLLYLLLVKKKTVQPYYVIDTSRLSIRAELCAIENIKEQLFTKHPHTRKLLQPTQYIGRNDIAQNKEITDSQKKVWDRTSVAYNVAYQYTWLARFVHERQIEGMELGIEGDLPSSNVPSRIISALKPFIIQVEIEGDNFYVIDKKYEDTPEYKLFKHFRFPIIHLSKSEMETIAKNENFVDLMELTHFCYFPLANGAPCGLCGPCDCTMKGGLRRRFPFRSRVRYYCYSLAKKGLAKYPTLYSFARKMKDKYALRISSSRL